MSAGSGVPSAPGRATGRRPSGAPPRRQSRSTARHRPRGPRPATRAGSRRPPRRCRRSPAPGRRASQAALEGIHGVAPLPGHGRRLPSGRSISTIACSARASRSPDSQWCTAYSWRSELRPIAACGRRPRSRRRSAPEHRIRSACGASRTRARPAASAAGQGAVDTPPARGRNRGSSDRSRRPPGRRSRRSRRAAGWRTGTAAALSSGRRSRADQRQHLVAAAFHLAGA